MAIWHASRPTVIDSGIRGKVFWNRRFKFFDFGRGRGPHKGFRCCLVVALSFFFFALPASLWKFSHFCSRPPFRVFTLESCSLFRFSFFFSHHFSFFIVLLCTWKFIPNRWMIYQESWLRKKDNSPVDYKKFLKEDSLQSEYPRLIKMDFSGT